MPTSPRTTGRSATPSPSATWTTDSSRPTGPDGRGAGDHPAKHRDIFRRRVARGQCFHRPYLGCREFAASFAEPDGSETPARRQADLGRMLFDLRYPAGSRAPVPVFFDARLDGGVLHVPDALYDAIHRLRTRNAEEVTP